MENMRKVHARKFAIGQDRQNVVGRRRFFRRLEGAADAVAARRWAHGCAPVPAPILADSLVRRRAVTRPPSVREVLCVGTDAEIAASVVQAIAVDVIDNHSWRGFGDDPVQEQAVALARRHIEVIVGSAKAEPSMTRNERQVFVINQRDVAAGKDEFGHLGSLIVSSRTEHVGAHALHGHEAVRGFMDSAGQLRAGLAAVPTGGDLPQVVRARTNRLRQRDAAVTVSDEGS